MKSVTIHGDVDPVQHPLWQRRFLTTDGLNAAVCFYVNEVLGVASSQPPNPPRQCVGGILADSMVSAQGLRVFNSVLIFMSSDSDSFLCIPFSTVRRTNNEKISLIGAR